MAKPPPSGSHSDITGVNRDARVGTPNRNVAKGTAAEIEESERQSKGRPAKSGKLGDSDKVS
jgi:hypothetical protein